MDLIQEGQKISLNFIKQDKLVEIIATINKVFDDRLIIELPPYFMRYIEYLDVGCLLMAKIFSKLGTIDFNSIVISSPLEEGHLEIELDVNALKLTAGDKIPVIDAIENLKITYNDGALYTQTFEISTEHIKFYSEVNFKINDSFDCELKLPKDYGTIKFKANVIEQDIVYENEYKASFYSMSEQDRENLLYYMYVYANSIAEDETNEQNSSEIKNSPEEQNSQNVQNK